MMKNVNLQIEIEIHPQVIWRLKLFMAIMRFAVWVGGFGGVEFDIPEHNLTPPAADGAYCANCKRETVNDEYGWCGVCGSRRS